MVITFSQKLKSLALATLMVLSTLAFGQQTGLGVSLGGLDFNGPQTGHYLFSDQYSFRQDTLNGFYDTTIVSKLFWSPLVRITFWKQLNTRVDFSATAHLSKTVLPASKKDMAFINNYKYHQKSYPKKFYSQVDARVHYNLLRRDRFVVSPYILAGIGAAYDGENLGMKVPVGAGAFFNLSKSLSLNLESSYHIAVTQNHFNNLNHSIGLVYWFKNNSERSPIQNAKAKDSDGDGLADEADRCPGIAGLVQFGGCPDGDGDGVPDDLDSCPHVAGLVGKQGCPDTDGDGIIDKEDRCPDVAGIAELSGCNYPDQDGDGFIDADDHCPEVYSKTNNGCPQTEPVIQTLYFDTKQHTLNSNSESVMKKVVHLLKTDEQATVTIKGYTDDVGTPENNLLLSQKRAQSVADYLKDNGISELRIQVESFGENYPAVSNDNNNHRAKNRRVEVSVIY